MSSMPSLSLFTATLPIRYHPGRLNSYHLYYFWWVAKAGGVVKAGEQLNITPHTISGQIGILEDDPGTPLYAKPGRNIELTYAGKLALGQTSVDRRLKGIHA